MSWVTSWHAARADVFFRQVDTPLPGPPFFRFHSTLTSSPVQRTPAATIQCGRRPSLPSLHPEPLPDSRLIDCSLSRALLWRTAGVLLLLLPLGRGALLFGFFLAFFRCIIPSPPFFLRRRVVSLRRKKDSAPGMSSSSELKSLLDSPLCVCVDPFPSEIVGAQD